MGRYTVGFAVLLLAGCGAATEAPIAPSTDAGPSDAGQALSIPPSQTFDTGRGKLTGSTAFPILSSQTVIEPNDAGISSYTGFQLSDVAQCVAATLEDGGASSVLPETTHVLTGFVRRLDGAPVALGSYAIGMTDGNQVQTYVAEVDLDRDSGTTVMRLATDGSVILAAGDGGHMEFGFDVTLGDPATSEALPLSGTFDSDLCTP